MGKIAENQTEKIGKQSSNSAVLKERIYVKGILREVSNYVPIESGTKVIEVGCGGGRFSKFLNDMSSLVATDITMERFDRSITKDFCLMDVHGLALSGECGDIAFCHFVLHHFEDLEKVTSEMARIASKYLVIIEPNPLHFNNIRLALFDREEKELRKFSIKKIKAAAELCGFQQVALFSVGLLPHSMVPDFLVNILLKLKFHQPFGWDQVLIMKRTEKPILN